MSGFLYGTARDTLRQKGGTSMERHQDGSRWAFDPLSRSHSARFVFSESDTRAVNIAIATGRPLLLRGPYGSGKSSLGRAIADVLGFSFFELQLNSTTAVDHLLYRYDTIARLNHAQTTINSPMPPEAYVALGPLGAAIAHGKPSVVLIEDLDLATASFQRDVVGILGQRRFFVAEANKEYSSNTQLIVVFTSEERAIMAEGVTARCVIHEMKTPQVAQLNAIAFMHYPDARPEVLDQIVRWVFKEGAQGALPAPGDLLSLLRVALELQMTPVDQSWEAIAAAMLPHRLVPTSDKGNLTIPEPTSGVDREGSPDVFLSYAREDAERAREIAARLEGDGWSVFWDREIPPGEHFDRVIEKALAVARCIVVLWSRTSVESSWVRAEANEGAERNVLVPALLEETVLPLRFRSIHYADLTGWTGAQNETGLEPLLRAVRRALRPR